MAEEGLNPKRPGIQVGFAGGLHPRATENGSDTPSGESSWGYAHATLSAFWSAVMITLSKWSMAELDPISLAALIMIFAAAAIAVWLSFTGGWKCLATLKGDGWKWTVGLSALFFFVIYGTFVAINLMDPTIVAFVSRTETLVTILLGVWIFGERFNRLEGIGAIFVVLGVVGLRYVGGVAVERGFWIILASSVGFGIAEAIAKKTVTIVDPIAFSLARTVILGAAFTVVALVNDDGLILPSQSLGWLAIIAIAISGPFLGRVHFLKALQKIHISKISIVTQSQPIFVALLALVILQTIPTQREWLGGAAILVGCAMLVLGRERPRRLGNGWDVTPAR